MLTHGTDAYVLATADAAQLLFSLRLRYSSEIPMAVWKMMAHAEARLNGELERYFRPAVSRESDERHRISA
jgi:hypothetical protein